jgi:hypothetical protein
MPIIAERFERSFKQCDESILNDTRGGDFRQLFVRQDAAVRRVYAAGETEGTGITLGNQAGQ